MKSPQNIQASHPINNIFQPIRLQYSLWFKPTTPDPDYSSGRAGDLLSTSVAVRLSLPVTWSMLTASISSMMVPVIIQHLSSNSECRDSVATWGFDHLSPPSSTSSSNFTHLHKKKVNMYWQLLCIYSHFIRYWLDFMHKIILFLFRHKSITFWNPGKIWAFLKKPLLKSYKLIRRFLNL